MFILSCGSHQSISVFPGVELVSAGLTVYFNIQKVTAPEIFCCKCCRFGFSRCFRKYDSGGIAVFFDVRSMLSFCALRIRRGLCDRLFLLPVTAAIIAVREVGTIGACAAKAYAVEIFPIQAGFTAQGVQMGFYSFLCSPPKITTMLGNGAAF